MAGCSVLAMRRAVVGHAGWRRVGLLGHARVVTSRGVKMAASDTEPPKENDAEDESATKVPTKGGSTVTSISKGLGRLIFSSSTAKAEMEVVANGLGSLVHIFFPQHSYIKVRPGTLIAHSGALKTHTSYLQNPFKSAARKLGGGPFALVTVAASGVEGDCLVSPEGLGDVAILGLDGSRSYCISNKSFLASTSNLSLGLSFVSDINPVLGRMYMKVSGTGDLAITARGGLFRLVLEPGEKYLASAKHLVAWDSSMHPKFQDTTEPGQQRSLFSRMTAPLRSLFQGKRTMCELHGPGDFYLTSRLDAFRPTRRFGLPSVFGSRSDDAGSEPRVITVTQTPMPGDVHKSSEVTKVNFTPDQSQQRESNADTAQTAEKEDKQQQEKKHAQEEEVEGETDKPKKPWYKFW
ncbi:hypothetical protein PTSG_03666 [Salpingoeca rosetta]|uniref:Altered inheritance of mitochondria protein 24, mitochondrial n=1 Tax=Salpingoeca rosetta (strain ATCC 50818 / BSB-021) TaxID=946362 RepID=F2U688_SALR5|nr:uncharacterized protein PTSG_03666 [Salpingoeca rosetta]EGD83029.1 hypothetical protein PTSG_03666 [Salpingoeca rosetta]|eukprot:XP_004995393.1 hypothetical protein PTSG_03666 [Salpingoeca rosetta]